jgi:hypothetical protein
VHEGRVEVLGEEGVQVGVALRVGQVQAVGDPSERGGGAGLEVQFDPGRPPSTGR